MKILIMLTSILLITGCLPRAMQPPPYAWEMFYKNKKMTLPFRLLQMI
ncbi:hypothetical protein NGM44_01545 [Moraxella sp. FZFQ2102]|nr:hypothetical protein [Moraxella sp. FZFQ2102]USZ15111.1 hypothetical protein NGM44_01545 [Moraxella sp. FZFQ2102]